MSAVLKKFALGITYDEKYTKSIRFEGDFKRSYDYVIALMNTYVKTYFWATLYKERIDPNNKNNTVYTYKKKNYVRPYSYIIKGNRMYDLVMLNCLNMSLEVLSYGVLNENNLTFKTMIAGLKECVIPNSAYKRMVSYKLGREVFG